MTLGVILPHTKLYGGVKRFFELGDVFLKIDHNFIVFTPEGTPPTWYAGQVKTLSLDLLNAYTLDALFITETQYLDQLTKANARRKILYFVRPSDSLRILKKYPSVEVFANSSNGYQTAKSKYKIEAFKAIGGINTHKYFPKEILGKDASEPFVVMTYGRLVERSKGTRIVVRACERLYKKGINIRLLLFDTPVNEKAEKAIKKFSTKVPFEFVLNHPVDKNIELFHRADIYVAAEKNTGHSNTSAEAMASGLPVIGTTSGTTDFLINNETGIVVPRRSRRIAEAIARLIGDLQLRQSLAYNGRRMIEEFSWEVLAQRILDQLSKS